MKKHPPDAGGHESPDSSTWWLPSPLLLFLGLVPAWAWAALLLGPILGLPLLMTLSTAYGYATGEAVLHFGGQHPMSSTGIDRHTRLPYRPVLGCLLDERDRQLHRLHNDILELLARVFGPMRGAYTGPFADLDEALAAVLEGYQHLDAAAVSRGEVDVDGRRLELSRDVRLALERTYWLQPRHSAGVRVGRTPSGLIVLAPEAPSDEVVLWVFEPTRHRYLGALRGPAPANYQAEVTQRWRAMLDEELRPRAAGAAPPAP